MQRIELDFVRRAPRSRWTGRVLLAVALGVAGDMAFTFVQLERTVKSNEAVLARAQPRKPAHAVMAKALLVQFEELQAVRIADRDRFRREVGE